MQYRTLGKTGLDVSALGFGAMRLPVTGEDKAVDVPATIRRFGDRILFAHFRDVELADDGVSFHETFQDDGRTDMVEAMRAYGEIGFDGVIRPDHVPLLETESGVANGYTMLGRLYAVGYMRGIAETSGISLV